jgi:NAD(P)-dependent dehydrogenase (short-subunit alcohol dehydrogenase family)
MLVRILADELRGDNIAVNELIPGLVRTDISTSGVPSGLSEEWVRRNNSPRQAGDGRLGNYSEDARPARLSDIGEDRRYCPERCCDAGSSRRD